MWFAEYVRIVRNDGCRRVLVVGPVALLITFPLGTAEGSCERSMHWGTNRAIERRYVGCRTPISVILVVSESLVHVSIAVARRYSAMVDSYWALTPCPVALVEICCTVAAEVPVARVALSFAIGIDKGISVQQELISTTLTTAAKFASNWSAVPFAVLWSILLRTANVSMPALRTLTVQVVTCSL